MELGMKQLKYLLLLLLSWGLSTQVNAQESQPTIIKVETIKVGTMGTYNPFSYVDNDNKLTGYDLDVLREISKRDPSLQFEFIASPWDTLFPGLDADKFQLIAQQITATPERHKRYYLTENAYFNSVSQFIVSSKRDDLQDESTLAGQKIGLTAGDAHTLFAEQWNAKHGDLFEPIYYDGDLPIVLQDIENGRLAGTVNDPIVAKDKAKVQGLHIKVIGDKIVSTPTYFIFKKDKKGAELRDRIDTALKSLIDDGSLSQLSIKWFGEDYTQ